ncbi:hypothetical protein FKF61_21595 [Salmonella enterica]|nr:hypothetical protein [Salmonella enterica]EBH2649693.1 hypothetical protein [Salmonella enterica]
MVMGKIVKRDLSIVDATPEDATKDIMLLMYIARIIEAAKPNSLYYIDIKASGRDVNSLRQAINTIAKEDHRTIKTITTDNGYIGFVIIDVKEAFV